MDPTPEPEAPSTPPPAESAEAPSGETNGEAGQPNAALEAAALRESMITSGLTGAIGVGFAAVAASDAVLLDGVYSLLSFVMAWVAARFMGLILAPSSEHFPFGRAALEPMVNIARSGLVIVVLVYAAISAFGDITSGGAGARTGIAVVYGGVIGAVGLAFAARQTRRAKQLGSSLLSVDAKSWWADGGISLAVGVAFLIGLILRFAGLEAPLPYVDPVVVLLLAAWLVREPYADIRSAFGELLQEAPDAALRTQVLEAVEHATAGEDVTTRQVKLWKLGRYLTVRVTLLMADPDAPVTYGHLDAIRDRLLEEVATVAPVVRVDVIFTADADWLDRGYA